MTAAARAVGADGFLRRLPSGYRTPPADAPFSGGERQRVGLARALCRPAPASSSWTTRPRVWTRSLRPPSSPPSAPTPPPACAPPAARPSPQPPISSSGSTTAASATPPPTTPSASPPTTAPSSPPPVRSSLHDAPSPHRSHPAARRPTPPRPRRGRPMTPPHPTAPRAARTLLRGALTGSLPQLVRLAAWTVLSAAPAALSGKALALAVDRGFLAHDLRAGWAWLGLFAVAATVSAWGTRNAYRPLARIVEPAGTGCCGRRRTARCGRRRRPGRIRMRRPSRWPGSPGRWRRCGTAWPGSCSWCRTWC
ncbi:hypothetical protein KCH_75830 [Kitasatospora cheerisanensis KCTC 2395]|uniref:Uncharacterized protein n=1 Tax=Kitasatospora cheerisanensis KCTC 2395 TaxID=1348663 RepID=A0A066YRY9_9ACTN|nr:hypothetical protein KCH_75830 [Kitasatospora cheerisanensis KCTC 2395]